MSLKKELFSFESDIDDLKIEGLRIIPQGEIKGVVQLVHGMCEYKERYIDFMKFLASRGYFCVIHDHRGHGKSIKDESDLGYFYDGGAAALVSDIHKVTVITKDYLNKFDNGERKIPYILLGHSMGSLAVRCYIKRYDDEIDKLIVVGCPSKLKGMKLGLFLIEMLKNIKGGHAHSALVDNIVIKSTYEKRYRSEKIVHAWVNSDRAKVEEYNADPLCNYTFTLNGYLNLVRLTMETYSKDGYAMKNKELPIMFFSGEGDPCAISRKDIWKAMQCLKSAGYSQVRARMYNGMRHEILNEPEHRRVYRDILSFIEK